MTCPLSSQSRPTWQPRNQEGPAITWWTDVILGIQMDLSVKMSTENLAWQVAIERDSESQQLSWGSTDGDAEVEHPSSVPAYGFPCRTQIPQEAERKGIAHISLPRRSWLARPFGMECLWLVM